MKTHLVLLSVAGLFLGGGCMTSPNNGATFDGSVIGRSFRYDGYYDKPGISLHLEILGDANADPTVESNWVAVAGGATTSSTTPFRRTPDTSPEYAWGFDAVPVPSAADAARWPQGGLARLRMIAIDAERDTGRYILLTFDEDFGRCYLRHQNESWDLLGFNCRSPYTPVAAQVNTTPSPAEAIPATGLGTTGYLSRRGNITRAQTDDYYRAIGAITTPGRPATLDTLDHFKSATRFAAASDQATATYYNDGDLGLGREMHCWSFVDAGATQRACYVTNYGKVGGVTVFGNQTVALDEAVRRDSPIATVAMIYKPPITAPNAVKFLVYDERGALQNFATLDTHGSNESVPNNCLVCHGAGVYNADSHQVSNARFLPFDPFSFKYSTVAPFTYDAQAQELRKLNQHVMNTEPAPGTIDFVTNLYSPSYDTDGATAVGSYIPAGWKDPVNDPVRKQEKLYNTVVKPYCRTCHASQSAFPFLRYSDFIGFGPTIGADVCTAHLMPQAEHTANNFWRSPARAHLVGALGLATACAPR